jgi:formamidopyrimidine-DNA glycosylase
MLELPECNVIAKQMKETIVGKKIVRAVANSSPHGFAWYWNDPAEYGMFLDGKKINDTAAHGGQIEIYAEDITIMVHDGANPRYFPAGAKLPPKHQLLLEFDSGDALCCTVQMYGGILAFPNSANSNFYSDAAKEKPSPLSDEFDATYFDSLFSTDTKPTMSAKAFLATKQRIPGLGNGVLHDILFNARIHPKRKLQTLGDNEKEALFNAVKTTLQSMTAGGGRDTEKDFFNRQGGYQSILSKNTLHAPCGVCGGILTRQAFLGGNIYFCGNCQPLI